MSSQSSSSLSTRSSSSNVIDLTGEPTLSETPTEMVDLVEETEEDDSCDQSARSTKTDDTSPTPEPEEAPPANRCPGCLYNSLGQRAHMVEPYGCLSDSIYFKRRRLE